VLDAYEVTNAENVLVSDSMSLKIPRTYDTSNDLLLLSVLHLGSASSAPVVREKGKSFDHPERIDIGFSCFSS